MTHCRTIYCITELQSAKTHAFIAITWS